MRYRFAILGLTLLLVPAISACAGDRKPERAQPASQQQTDTAGQREGSGDIGEDAHNAAKALGQGTHDALRAVGHGARETTKAIGHGTRDVIHGIGDGLSEGWEKAKEDE